jgi:predicted ATPase
MFDLTLHDEQGTYHDIGKVKIGFIGQTKQISTHSKLNVEFQYLASEFFSLGQGTDYYRKLAALPNGYGKKVLTALRDMVVDPNIVDEVKDEEVFKISLLRDTSLSMVRGQYVRVLNGQAELTNFKFKFHRPEVGDLGEISIKFNVKTESTPSTNVHAVIGRNGVGKTTLLNGMIEAITDRKGPGRFLDCSGWTTSEIAEDYFSSLVSVSFSAFDPFSPPQEQPDPSKGICYSYIGLKNPEEKDRHRTIAELRIDCVKSLSACFRSLEKTARWLKAIQKLGSDENFSRMKLEQLVNVFLGIGENLPYVGQSDTQEFLDHYFQLAFPYLSKMSSGHAIVLLTITRLVEAVQEKTLVLLDEPESHLHPPLLSAFIRALTELLYEQNGVAIIATHSPVVLQEIPKSCVWKVCRTGKSITIKNPDIETFGENVGLLTSDVFSLEVERSGFHSLLIKDVAAGETYDQVLEKYNQQLGIEGRSILSSLIAHREREKQS